jgi:putative heme-binding domain-containing protein
MFRVIARGIPGSPMPASSLNGRPIWQIVAYVRSFADQSAAAGNPQRGAALFVQFNCAGCHNGAAPDLAAAILGPAEIRQSILEPNARVAPEYWRVSAVSASGETIEGLRLNEDTFTLQLLTREGALRTLHRDALREIKYLKTSPMPSFQGKIPAAALDDLTAYIQSLRDPVR